MPGIELPGGDQAGTDWLGIVSGGKGPPAGLPAMTEVCTMSHTWFQRPHHASSPYQPRLEEFERRCLLSFNEFPVPTPASDPNGIAAGPDGNVWFCEDAAAQLG